ncbi:FAD-binding oxidoreductase [Allopusillimonas soli]
MHPVVERLIDVLGSSAVVWRSREMAAYVEDWRGRHAGKAMCVALPSSTEEVSAIVKLCAREQIPILPQGGNTSLCGGAVPSGGEPAPVVVNLARMRHVRSVDVDNHTMEVEAGCVLADIQALAAQHGLLYPISLGSEGSCQIGGNISTNAGGTGVLRYGNTRENILGLEVVLADGTIWDGLRGLRKDNTGLDLKHLFIAAEGTMGIVTAAILKLHPLPRAYAFAWVAVRSPHDALQLLTQCRAAFGPRLTAFEMMNAAQLNLVLEHVPGRRNPLAGNHNWHVLVELADDQEGAEGSQDMQRLLEKAYAQGLLLDAAIAVSEAHRHEMWQVRHSVSEANKKAGVGLTSDTAVPVSRVPDFIDKATAAVREIVPEIGVVVVAHLGDGNVHFIPFFSFKQWASLDAPEATAESIRRAVNDAAYALDGTFSAEHGVGQVYVSQRARYKLPVELAMMRAVKQAFDPHDLLNPGRLLP